ncbi:MAG: protein kinase [Deltaproteobacteria bacterium]|nr:protein kinase [Deltaproteobacteria bacterium]
MTQEPGKKKPPRKTLDDSVQVALPEWLKAHPTPPSAATATFHPDAPAGSSASDELPAPGPAARHRVEDRGVIARGGFGSIHRAYDHDLKRMVAMKTLDPERAGAPKARLRFVEEAQITGQLDHPNIVPVHELGLDGEGRHFFTMKLVRGETLTQILKKHPDAASTGEGLDEILEILVRVCDALSFAHSRGVVHRDLKPDNIMVGAFGQVYVMDWGIAMLVAGARSGGEVEDPVVIARKAGNADARGTVVGTFAYMAPEQALGENDHIDERTDVFAMGALLYQVLTGRPPYGGATPLEKVMAAQKGRIPLPGEVADRPLPPALCQVAMRAMRRPPEDRYQTIEDFRRELERFRGGYWFPTETFAPGTVVVKEGDEADAAYIITEGSCEVFHMEHGRKTPLRTMGPGDVFGETAIFTSKPRTASVRAVTELTVMVVTREALEQQLVERHWMGTFVKALAARFRELDAHATGLRTTAEDARMMARALEHLAFHGAAEGEARVAPWAPLARALGAEFGKAEAELVSVLGRQAGLHVDAAKDRVVLTRTGGSSAWPGR